MTQVCDFASPVDLQAVAAHFSGILRYVSDYSWKNITPSEFSSALKLGLQVTLVCEQDKQPALRGTLGGMHDSTIANQQANAVGYDPHSTIYYVAEDPTVLPTSSWPTVEAYFKALTWGGTRPIGAYGSGPLVSHLLALGLVTKTWNVSTWGKATVPLNLTQVVGGNTYGLSVDVDQVWTVDYGQHPRPVQPVPPPTPPPTPEEALMADNATVIESPNDGNRHVFVDRESLNLTYHFWQRMTGTDFTWHFEELKPS